MKKVIVFLIIAAVFTGFSASKLTAAPAENELKASESSLSIDRRGNIKIVHNEGEVLEVNSPLNNLWKIVIKDKTNGRDYTFTPEDNFKIDKVDNSIRIVVNSFSVDNKTLPVSAEFTISVKDDAFCFSGSLKSNSDDLMIKVVDYPNLTGIKFKNGKAGIYWPAGLGQYFEDPAEFGSRELRYPAAMGGAMPWLSMNSDNVGLYVGSHDQLKKVANLNLSYDGSSDLFSAFINAPVYDKTYQIPEIMVKPYSGKWHAASKFYRSWYDKHFEIVEPPEWVKGNSGWLLAILKQQNLEVMWPYKDIDKLCDVAEEFNLGTIGLFGWAVGGHDKYYPNYPPDNTMGGRKELEAAIKRAQKRGIKIILYANGKLIDTSTDYYEYNGFQTILFNEYMRPDINYYHKQKNTTPVIFAQACTGSEVWRRTMHDLGVQAVLLGADGILYDQLGVWLPELCFSGNHDHKPGEADTKYRLQMINEISTNMKKINPDFAIMTEATNDVVIRGIDYTHGWGIGTAPSANVFSELFRYTFPELITTQRNPNPMITRTDANYAAIYGLRHEIESRYPDDVEYLLHGTLPTRESYAIENSPPNVSKMNQLPKKEAAKYVHTLIEFENDNGDFFRTGKFIDEEGIEITGDDIMAKGFLNGNRLGVVVWNKHLTEQRDCQVSVPGYRLVNSSEPGRENVNNSSPLEANSLRLLIFEK